MMEFNLNWNSIIFTSFLFFFNIMMLPKAHLTLHSKISGSRWVITLSWLFWSWWSFLYISSVYFSHVFLISSILSLLYVYQWSIPFLSFIMLIFAWNIPLVSLIFYSSIQKMAKQSEIYGPCVFFYCRLMGWEHACEHTVSSINLSSVISRPHPKFSFARKKTVLPTVSGEHDSASDWLGC